MFIVQRSTFSILILCILIISISLITTHFLICFPLFFVWWCSHLHPHSFGLHTEISKNLINKDGQKQIPEKGPVMLLYELFNDVNIECASADGAQHSRFKMVATVNDRKFEGTGFYPQSKNKYTQASFLFIFQNLKKSILIGVIN